MRERYMLLPGLSEIQPIQLHPCVRIQAASLFSHAQLEFRRQASSPQQPVDEQGLSQAGGLDRTAAAGNFGNHCQATGRFKVVGTGRSGRSLR